MLAPTTRPRTAAALSLALLATFVLLLVGSILAYPGGSWADPAAEGFQPFAVGYVGLPDGVRVEAVLESVDDPDYDALTGAEVTLVATQPVPRFATREWLEAHSGEGVDAPTEGRSEQ